MVVSGYSGTPLQKKLGIKECFTINIINAPEHFSRLLGPLEESIVITKNKTTRKDFIHFFSKDLSNYKKQLPVLKGQLKPNGMIWISWPKKASKIITDISEDLIREFALKTGLVDIKVCAIDDVWSGLKLVIPVKERTQE